MSKLSERAMLAALHTGSWSGAAHDQQVTEEVSESHKAAERDAGRYTKQLVASKFLRHVSGKMGVARRVHRLLTLPWDDDGTRILSCAGHKHYTEQMRLMRHTIEAAAGEFVKGMPDYIKEARERLGTMFDSADYPDADEVRKKFYVDVEIKPIPEAGDFRAQLSDASVKAIVKDIEQRSNARIEAAMNDVFERIAGVTGRMAERLRAYKPVVVEGEKKTVLQDTVIYSIKELADLLPSLNITNDPRLVTLQKQLLKDLVEHSPEVLRADPKKRNQTADRAEAIFRKVSSYLA